MKHFIFVFMALAALVTSCKKEQQITHKEQTLLTESTFTLTPVFKSIDVPFQEKIVLASKATTITLEDGSFIDIPKDAFVDSEGKVITGKVALQFRTFNNSLDILVSGIPMKYQTNGKNYMFESAAMIEIKPVDPSVKIAAGKSLGVAMKSDIDNTSDFNMYLLDETTGIWQVSKKDSLVTKEEATYSYLDETDGITKLRDTLLSTESLSEEIKISPFPTPQKPIKPVKKAGGELLLTVNTNGSHLEELKIFQNVDFKVLNRDTYKKGDNQHEWHDVTLNRIRNQEYYWLVFKGKTSGGKDITKKYKVLPSYGGEQYATALEDYDKRYKEYLKKVEEQKRQIRLEEKRIKEERANSAKIQKKRRSLYRYFKTESFGIYNCDYFYNTKEETIEFYTEVSNEDLKLSELHMIDASRNRTIKLFNFNRFQGFKDGEFHLVGVDSEGQIVYAKNLSTKNLDKNNTLSLTYTIADVNSLEEFSKHLN